MICRTFNILLRTVTVAIVAAPLVGWIALMYTFPHPVGHSCAPTDYECRIDALDEHTTP
jgi:hypothetical protein